MKTLDEVIKAHEMCIERIGKGEDNCPANCPCVECCDPEGESLKRDTLHYLVEMKLFYNAYINGVSNEDAG